MTERTSLISCIFRHVTEEAGIEHGKKNLKNDTDFETIPILTINIVMVFCLPFVGPKGIDFTLQSVGLFYSRILIFWLNPKARNIDKKNNPCFIHFRRVIQEKKINPALKKLPRKLAGIYLPK